MSTLLHAQPYDITAKGFYFRSVEEYDHKALTVKNDIGDIVEEFEIQFIDGKAIDCELAKEIGLSQCNIEQYFTWAENWSDEEKIRFIVAVGECGYVFNKNIDPNDFDLDLYHETTMRELAENFVDEGLFGEIPENLEPYLDYDAIARDLSFDYSETKIAGKSWIYRCG